MKSPKPEPKNTPVKKTTKATKATPAKKSATKKATPIAPAKKVPAKKAPAKKTSIKHTSSNPAVTALASSPFLIPVGNQTTEELLSTLCTRVNLMHTAILAMQEQLQSLPKNKVPSLSKGTMTWQ